MVCLAITFWNTEVLAEYCVKHPQDLKKTDRLRTLSILPAEIGETGYVNETQGSYLVIKNSENGISITLYTSGLFDLVPIRRSFPVELCDDGAEFYILLGKDGRKERLAQHNQQLIIGNGGPKGTFHIGRMPAALLQLHGL